MLDMLILFVFGPCGWRVYIRKLKLGAGRHGYIQKILLWMILMEPLSPKTEIEHEVLDYHSLASKHILPRVGESLISPRFLSYPVIVFLAFVDCFL